MALSGSDLAYKYARAGIARAGASRHNYYRPINWQVIINGTTRATWYPESLEVTNLLNQQYDTANLTVYGFTPAVGQAVVLGLGSADNRVFGGRIVSMTTRIGTRSFERVEYDLACRDYTADLDRKLVTQTFATQSATALVATLLSTYTSGFTTTHVQQGLANVTTFAATFETVSSCLTRIANEIGAQWYVDPYQDVHFFTSESLDGTPETLSTSSEFEWRNLSYTKDLSQIRTRVYCEGGGARLLASRTATEFGSWYDNGSGWTTRGPATGSANDAGLYVDATVYGFGASDRIRVGQSLYRADTSVAAYDDLTMPQDQIATTTGAVAVGATTIPVSTLTGLPPASGSTQKGIVIIGGQVIFYTDTTGGGSPSLDGIPASGEGSIVQAIASGADVVVPAYLQIDDANPGSEFVAQTHQVGDPVRSIRVRNDSSAQTALAALDGSDGIVDAYVRDERDDYLRAAARGDAELVMWSDPAESIEYETRDTNARAGKSVTLNVAGLSGSYLIQSVRIRGPIEGLNVFPWRTVKAGSQRYDLYDTLRRVEGRN